MNLQVGQVALLGDIPLHYHVRAHALRDMIGQTMFSLMFRFCFRKKSVGSPIFHV